MKKIVLSLLLLAGCFFYAFSQTSGTCGENLVWRLSDGTLTIRPVEGTTGGSMENYTGLTPWRNSRSDISKVIIKEGVTSIGARAFEDCSSLTSVTIPESVTSIGFKAFDGCTSISSPLYNNKVFAYMPQYYKGEYVIPSGIQSIAGRAFYNCTGLTSVTIPESVTSIRSSAFSGCTGLTSVTIPESVTTIGSGVFSDCSGLSSVEWNAVACQETVYGSEDLPFYNCKNITAFTFGNQVERIPAYLCYGLDKLASVTIPENVTSIGDLAFYRCSGLTSVTIPESVTSIGVQAFRDCSSLTSVTIPESVTSIGEQAFMDCSSLTSVTIPEGVTYIGGRYAFSGCRSLTSVTIPEGVTSIGEAAFRDCSSLTSVTIPEGVTSIGSRAFADCRSLTSVTIPNSVTSIGYSAFEGCTGLTSVTIGESVTSIGSEAFYDCIRLTSVTIPESVTYIGSYAFSSCSSLEEIINYRHDPISLNESSSPFEDLNVDEIRLVVPVGCVPVYKEAKVWRDFQIVDMLVAPEFSEKENVVTCGTEIGLDCASSDVVIYYGIGKDAEPTLLYEGGIAITDTTYICALAQRGDESSEVVRVTYFANHVSSLTAHERVESCTETGREAYWECKRCGKLFSDAEATTEITEPVEIAATGHAYGQPVWTWTDDYQASVTFTCTACPHEEHPEVTVTSAITRPATPTEEGERVYLATAFFEGETYRDTRTEVIPRLEDPTASSEVNVLAEGVKIYPNPSRGEFKVELPIDAQVEIFDASGKRVLAQTCSAGTHGLNLVQTGMYVLRVFAVGQQATFRLVVR